MMGPKQEAQAALFYEFSLEDHVPQDHLLRSINRFVDLTSIRAHLAEFYSHTGRPSVDPELLIRMLLVGYCIGIRSERRLCEEVHLNLAYRWFCRLDLNGIRAHLADFYSHTGRPSVDPELLIRMLLLGYCFGIRSERRLSEEVHLNLAYRWFCRLDLNDRVPDHST